MFRFSTLVLFVLMTGCPKNEVGDQTPTDPVVKNVEENVPNSEPTKTEITFEAAGTTVHGTLVKPHTSKPLPAVILIAGSGPTDRNWESKLIPGDNGSARLLADALAKNGIATLRYDKRGTGKTAMPKEPLNWSMYVAEIDAARALLATDPEIRKDAIFLGGNSEGGAHAIRAAQTIDFAGIMLLATSGRSLGDIMIWQIDQQLEGAGVSSMERATHKTKLENAFKEIASGKKIDVTKASPYPGVQNLVLSLTHESSGTFVAEILAWDPADELKKITQPVLILNGDKDIQVDATIDAPLLKKAKPDATYVIVKDADHVLKNEMRDRDSLTAAAGLEYNSEGRTLSDGVVNAMTKFVAEVSDGD